MSRQDIPVNVVRVFSAKVAFTRWPGYAKDDPRGDETHRIFVAITRPEIDEQRGYYEMRGTADNLDFDGEGNVTVMGFEEL